MKGLKKLIALSLSVVLGIMCLISASSMAVLASSGNENDELIHEATIISEKFIDPELVGTKLSEVDPSNQVTTLNAYGERHVLSATFTTKKLYTLDLQGSLRWDMQVGQVLLLVLLRSEAAHLNLL